MRAPIRMVWMVCWAGCVGPLEKESADSATRLGTQPDRTGASENPTTSESSTPPPSYKTSTAAEDAVQVCLVACASAADCATGVEAYDEDNYTCEDGGCVYTGCTSDDECRSLGDYLCTESAGPSVCQPACDSVSDCVLGLAPYDSDNYECNDGVCAYLGCLSDEECQDLGAYTCAPSSGDVRYCTMACSSVSDCVGPGAPFDEDNYDCKAGACVYTGCLSDEECSDMGAFVCGEPTL